MATMNFDHHIAVTLITLGCLDSYHLLNNVEVFAGVGGLQGFIKA
jgi:hypothetical protein